MQLDSNQIARILPHRYPFALVDRIVDGEEGRWAKGIKCVSVNEQFFCGHFPQEHIMPGREKIVPSSVPCKRGCPRVLTSQLRGIST